MELLAVGGGLLLGSNETRMVAWIRGCLEPLFPFLTFQMEEGGVLQKAAMYLKRAELGVSSMPASFVQ